MTQCGESFRKFGEAKKSLTCVTFWGFDRIAFGSTTFLWHRYIIVVCILFSQITENAQQCEMMQAPAATDAEQHPSKMLRQRVQEGREWCVGDVACFNRK